MNTGPTHQNFSKPNYNNFNPNQKNTFNKNKFGGSHHNDRKPPFNANNNNNYNNNNNFNKNMNNNHFNNNNNNYKAGPKYNNQKQANSQNVSLSLEVKFLSDLNNTRYQNKLPSLIFKGAINIENFSLVWLKNQNFCILFDNQNNCIVENQLSINTDINNAVLEIKKGKFGDIQADFIFVNYIHFNEITLKTYSKILITPTTCLESHSNFLTIDISDQAPITCFEINENYLLASVHDERSNNSTIYVALISDILQHSSNLKNLQKIITSGLKSFPVDGKVTNIKASGSNALFCMADGTISVKDFSNNMSNNIQIFNQQNIFIDTIGNELVCATENGEIAIVSLGNQISKRLTSQFNTSMYKMKTILLKNGKTNKVSYN